MRKKTYILLIILLNSLNIIAQEGEIEKEIANYKNSDTEMILKARRMLIDKIQENDFSKMKEIKDYLTNKIDKQSYNALYLPELWLILYWTQEYDELLSNIKETGFEQNARVISKKSTWTGTSKSRLISTLQEKSTNEKDMVLVLIDNAKINNEEKDFLKLHLDYCLSAHQDTLNKKSDEFMLKYHQSAFTPFIKKVIRYKEHISQFSWGYDVFLGYSFLNGGISDSFEDYFSFGMTMEMTYANFYLGGAFSLGSSELLKDIPYGTVTWNKGKRGDIILPQANFGYTFFNDKKLSITPFVGVSGIYIWPNYNDIPATSAYEEIELIADASWNIGVSINLNSKTISMPGFARRKSKFRASVKLKYNYIKSGFKKDYYGLDGDIHQITLAVGGNAWKVRAI